MGSRRAVGTGCLGGATPLTEALPPQPARHRLRLVPQPPQVHQVPHLHAVQVAHHQDRVGAAGTAHAGALPLQPPRLHGQEALGGVKALGALPTAPLLGLHICPASGTEASSPRGLPPAGWAGDNSPPTLPACPPHPKPTADSVLPVMSLPAGWGVWETARACPTCPRKPPEILPRPSSRALKL